MSNHPPRTVIKHRSSQLYLDYSLLITAITKNTENIAHTIIVLQTKRFTVCRRRNFGHNVFLVNILRLIMSFSLICAQNKLFLTKHDL